MAYTTINKSTDYFNTLLYTDNGANRTLTGVGFQPDWVWIKTRNHTNSHNLFDAVRGANKVIRSNQNYAEATTTDTLTAFTSDGFSLGVDASGYGVNYDNKNEVAWNWKAGTGQGSSNTDGTINTTYTSANTTSGFSISTYTGTGSVATVGHGLGSVPKTIIIKRLNTTSNWGFYNSSLGATKYLLLNITDAAGTASSIWNDTAPTSSVFTIGTSNDVNASGGTYVAYCFAEKKGFSKFSSHVGNGSTDGVFLYTGFKPAWFLLKPSSGSGQWFVWDSKRSTINQAQKILSPESSAVEADATGAAVDFLSNGIKIRNSDGGINQSGVTYITMAFAEAPLVGSNNIPCTAR